MEKQLEKLLKLSTPGMVVEEVSLETFNKMFDAEAVKRDVGEGSTLLKVTNGPEGDENMFVFELTEDGRVYTAGTVEDKDYEPMFVDEFYQLLKASRVLLGGIPKDKNEALNEFTLDEVKYTVILLPPGRDIADMKGRAISAPHKMHSTVEEAQKALKDAVPEESIRSAYTIAKVRGGKFLGVGTKVL